MIQELSLHDLIRRPIPLRHLSLRTYDNLDSHGTFFKTSKQKGFDTLLIKTFLDKYKYKCSCSDVISISCARYKHNLIQFLEKHHKVMIKDKEKRAEDSISNVEKKTQEEKDPSPDCITFVKKNIHVLFIYMKSSRIIDVAGQ